MITSVFWNTSHKRQTERPGDPLGFDALREMMSDCLVPDLTGGTRHADDYLWVLVGLRWARGDAATKVDAEVWGAFRKFERALKQYWERTKIRQDYSGKLKVANLCKQERPNVNQPILTNERAGGLLGSYIVSLRNIGLVEKSALALTKAGDQIIQGVGFTAGKRTFTSWSALGDGFSTTEREVRTRRKALGIHLFRDDHMRLAASATLSCPTAKSWNELAARLNGEQRRIASACVAVINAETAMVEAFIELMSGRTKLTAEQSTSVRNTSIRVRTGKPIPVAKSNQPTAKALDGAWSACVNGRHIETQLVDLHVNVARSIRGNEPWIARLGEKSLIEYRLGTVERDFRIGNLRRLVKETNWRPDATRA
jgi:hypothetical protein